MYDVLPPTPRLCWLLDKMRQYALRPCLEGDGGSYSYLQLLDEIDRWRSRLAALRVAPGDVIALRADYCCSAIAAMLALFLHGATAALIPRDRDSMRFLLDAHASGLLEFDGAGIWQWRPLPTPARHALLDRLHDARESGIVIFTSGSTGRPKAALQSVERFLHKMQGLTRSFRSLAFLLFDHIAGMDTLMSTLATGGTLIVTHTRDPESVMRMIALHGVEILPTTPSFLRLLCATRSSDAHDLSSIKLVAYSSEPMDPDTLLRVNARFPNARISQKYGTTETGSPRSISRSNDSLWMKFKEGVETKVVNGVLWLRSEGTILGYLNAPPVLDDEGWYYTGDLVEIDGEWLKFCGRLSDTINVGGEKVAPAEVEQAIRQLSFVREVVVTGETHALMGQVVTARVSLAMPMDPKQAAARIRAHCRKSLAPHKVPVRIQVGTESLTNARHKVQRALTSN